MDFYKRSRFTNTPSHISTRIASGAQCTVFLFIFGMNFSDATGDQLSKDLILGIVSRSEMASWPVHGARKYLPICLPCYKIALINNQQSGWRTTASYKRTLAHVFHGSWTTKFLLWQGRSSELFYWFEHGKWAFRIAKKSFGAKLLLSRSGGWSKVEWATRIYPVPTVGAVGIPRWSSSGQKESRETIWLIGRWLDRVLAKVSTK